METTWISIKRRMDKDVVHMYNRILLGHKKEWYNAICSNMDATRDDHTKWSQRKTNTIIYYLYCSHRCVPCTFLPEGICSCCSWPRDRTQVSHNAGRRFNLWATREALCQKCSSSNIWVAYFFTSFSPLFKRLLLSRLSRPSFLKLQPSWSFPLLLLYSAS